MKSNLSGLLSAFVFCLAFPTSMLAADRPNIIIMMADDMGFSDIGCFGGEIHTPALDRLAKGGLRFTQFYNTGRCCPTRASLLSGLYPHQAGVGWMMADNGHDGYRGELNRRCVTIAEVLKAAGYSTYMSGKWHVTKHVRAEGPKDNWPRQRGFDRFFGTIHGAGSFYDPNSLTRDNTQIAPEGDFYYTDAISENATRYIRDHHDNSDGNPFFLYVAYTAPHWPMHALPEDIQRYRGRYDDGWDALRVQRHARMIRMGLVKKEWGLTERDTGVPTWPEAKLRSWHIRRMEVYAAMVDRMDQGVSRIVRALDDTGELDDTLILFLADNGGCAEEYGSKGPVRPDPSKPFEVVRMKPGELQTAMQPRVTRDGRPVKTGQGVLPGPADTYVAYGKAWANASNTPFRRYKHWVHEGGISTPLIAHWPDKIKRTGELEHQPGHLIDLMATCVDVAGARYPAMHADRKIQPMEGRSLAPAFRNEKIEREALYWEHEGNRAVRVDNWKLVAAGAKGPWELYDLESDRTERHDLAEKHPEKAKELSELWEAYARRTNVYPLVPYRNRAKKKLNKKKRFKLESGDDLSQDQAPAVSGRAFEIEADVRGKDRQGVIVAQGGDAHGFALYLKDGLVQFATRRQGKLTVVAGGEVPSANFQVRAALGKDGRVVLHIDDKLVAEKQTEGALVAMPQDGLQVGSDKNGPVGEYEAPFQLDAKLQVRIQLVP